MSGDLCITNKSDDHFQPMQTLSNKTGHCLLISGVIKGNKKVHFFRFHLMVRGGHNDRFHGNLGT